MGRTIRASSGALTPMWRRDPKGNLVKIAEPDPSDYITPPDGTKARFRLSGISEEFEMDSQFNDKPDTKIRVEFELVKVSNASLKYLEEKRFTDLYNWTVGPKSNLGKLIGRLRGWEIERGEDVDIDAYIGTEFVAMTHLSANGNYAGISPEAIERDKTRLSSHVNGTKPESAPVGAPLDAGDEDSDPFQEDQEEL